MLLSEVKKCKKYEIKCVKDKLLGDRLKQFGFVEHTVFSVLKIHKGDVVLRIIGSMYAINSRVAEVIEVEEINE